MRPSLAHLCIELVLMGSSKRFAWAGESGQQAGFARVGRLSWPASRECPFDWVTALGSQRLLDSGSALAFARDSLVLLSLASKQDVWA